MSRLAGSLAALALARREGVYKPALARMLAEIERKPDAPEICRELTAAWESPEAARTHAIGVTGPPGVGKSTLIGALLRHWRSTQRSAAVIAVDPSSHRSGGALLGDRTRIVADPLDAELFVRSMAARDRLGGLSAHTFPAVVLLRALFDIVVVETVGVGQSETEIRNAVDTVLLCLQPGAGDMLQYMKAGIVEIPDLLAVTKSDLGDLARRALADAAGGLGLAQPRGWQAKPMAVSTLRQEGIAELASALEQHRMWLKDSGEFEKQRRRQGRAWLEARAGALYGQKGLERLRGMGALGGRSPFAEWPAARDRLERG